MNERDRLYLQHILDAIEAIEDFTAGGREQFFADRKTQSAVIRQIENPRRSGEASQYGPD